jgi:Mrp family chromosome partitioning ATPase
MSGYPTAPPFARRRGAAAAAMGMARYWRLSLLVFVGVTALSIAIAYGLPAVYESTATLEVTPSTDGKPGSTVDDAKSLLSDRERLGRLLHEPSLQGSEQTLSLDTLSAAATVTASSEHLLALAFRGDSPDVARDRCGALADVLVAHFGKDPKSAARAELERSTKALADFVNAHPGVLLEETASGTSAAHPASKPSAASNDQALNVLKKEKARLEAELAQQPATDTPKNPYDEGAPGPDDLQRQLAQVKYAISARLRAAAAPSPTAAPNPAAPDQVALQTQWRSLVRAVVDAEHPSTALPATGSARIVQAPTLPDHPIKPNRLLVTGGGVAAALWLSLLAAVIQFVRGERGLPGPSRPQRFETPVLDGNPPPPRFAARSMSPAASPSAVSHAPTTPRVASGNTSGNSGTRIGMMDPALVRTQIGGTPADLLAPLLARSGTPELGPSRDAIRPQPAEPAAVGPSGTSDQSPKTLKGSSLLPNDAPGAMRTSPSDIPGATRTSQSDAPGATRPSQSDAPGATRPSQSDAPGATRPSQSDAPGATRTSQSDRPNARPDVTRASPGDAPLEVRARSSNPPLIPRPKSEPPRTQTSEVVSPSRMPPPQQMPAAMRAKEVFRPPPAIRSAPPQDFIPSPTTQRVGSAYGLSEDFPKTISPPPPPPSVPPRADLSGTKYSFVDRGRTSRPPRVAESASPSSVRPGPQSTRSQPSGRPAPLVEVQNLTNGPEGADPRRRSTRPPDVAERPRTILNESIQSTRAAEVWQKVSAPPAQEGGVVRRPVSATWRMQTGLKGGNGALDGLRDKIFDFAANGPFVVAVTSERDSLEAKTAIASRLSVMLSDGGRVRVLLLEANFDFPSVHRIMSIDMPPGGGFSQQMRARLRSGERKPWNVVQCTDTLDVLAEGLLRSPGVLLLQEFANAVTELRDFYDVIVIDSPPAGPGVETKPISSVSDGVAIVAPSPATLREVLERGMRWYGQKKLVVAIPAKETS